MAQRAKSETRTVYPRSRTFGNAAVSARQQFAWLWSRESVLRLVLSFVLAVALWLYVTNKQDPTQAWDFPQPLQVVAQNVPDGYIVANNIFPVRVRVRADTRTVSVTTSSFHTFVDLTHVRPGVHNLPVKVAADPGISILSVTPSSIPVNVQRIIFNHVPVNVHVLTPPPVGYRIGLIRVNPSAVTVFGPQTVVSQVSQTVVYVDLSGARSSFLGTSYKLSPEDSQSVTVTGHLSLDPSHVDIDVSIVPVTTYKTLPVLVPIGGVPKRGFGVVSLAVKPVEITASGSPSLLDRISSLSTYPISIANRGNGSFSTNVQLRLPHGIQASQRWVTVTTQVGPVVASSSIELAISPQNVTQGLIARTNPGSVLVTVIGPSSALRQAAGQMKAVVNLSGDGVGRFYLTPRVFAPRGLRVENVYPTQVAVDLRSTSAG